MNKKSLLFFLPLFFVAFVVKGQKTWSVPKLGTANFNNILPKPPYDFPEKREEEEERHKRKIPLLNFENALPKGKDPLFVAEEKALLREKTNAPILSVQLSREVINQQDADFASPPDASAEVGFNHLFTFTNSNSNSVYRAFDKTGQPLISVRSTSTFWQVLGETSGGDPIICFDQIARRWILTEISDNAVLLAISATEDPVGAYSAYKIPTPEGLPDYAKLGIWKDRYVITTNAAKLDVLDVLLIPRQELLNGATNLSVKLVEIPRFNKTGQYFETITPVDIDGFLLPETNANLPLVRVYDDAFGGSGNQDAIEIWEIKNDTLIKTPQRLITQPFDFQVCPSNSSFDCIPQPNTTEKLDPVENVVMFKSSYRRFDTHESIVLCHTADATGTNIAGIRWYELRKNANTTAWTIYQQGLFAPDVTVHRFIPSIAINKDGSIALAYAVSNSTNTFAGLRLTGRVKSDPLGQMTLPETVIVNGLSFLKGGRFGDYAQMSVDPSNDLTFWYMGEYAINNNLWSTRATAFTLSSDPSAIESVEGLKIQITPNPANDFITVRTSENPTSPLNYQVYNLLGQTLLSGQLVEKEQSITVTTLPSGIYTFSVGKKALKFVKQF